MARATIREIQGPDGLLARKVDFEGSSISAKMHPDGMYVVKSYDTPIAYWTKGKGAVVTDHFFSRKTSRHQNLCRAWL